MTDVSNRIVPPRVLTVPGLDGSGPGHWQTIWERTRDDTVRVEFGRWERPHRNSWITKLDQAIRDARRPVVLAAHSLGCVAVAWWAAFAGRLPGSRVIGALLVAPADVDRPACDRIASFAPLPLRRLPFPSLLVASRDDPWIAIDRAAGLAARWGSGFVDVGQHGHLNADSGLGQWPKGLALLERLIESTPSGWPPDDANPIPTVLAPPGGGADTAVRGAEPGVPPA